MSTAARLILGLCLTTFLSIALPVERDPVKRSTIDQQKKAIFRLGRSLTALSFINNSLGSRGKAHFSIWSFAKKVFAFGGYREQCRWGEGNAKATTVWCLSSKF